MVAAVVGLMIAGCGGDGVPDSADDILDIWEDAGLAACSQRREPVPDVVTCEDAASGDLTVGLTETAIDTVSSTAASADGPWIVGETFVVITYDDDEDRVRQLRDELGSGEIYVVNDEDQPEILPDP